MDIQGLVPTKWPRWKKNDCNPPSTQLLERCKQDLFADLLLLEDDDEASSAALGAGAARCSRHISKRNPFIADLQASRGGSCRSVRQNNGLGRCSCPHVTAATTPRPAGKRSQNHIQCTPNIRRM
jgi:hypothetical protein